MTTSQILAVVPTPMSASGAVSGGDLERYVRWFRGADVLGVVVWSRLGAGQLLDATEREEVYAVWRSGLLPHQQVWACVPAGEREIAADAVRFEAAHARELGADGIVTTDLHFRAVRELMPAMPVLAPGISMDGVATSVHAAIRAAELRDKELCHLGENDQAAVLLAVLQARGAITNAGIYSPEGKAAGAELKGLIKRLTDDAMG
jgi:hypothetical protein